MRVALAGVGALAAWAAGAQSPPSGGGLLAAPLELKRPSERPLDVPSFQAPQEVLPKVLPPAPQLRPRTSGGPVVVKLSRIELDGNTVFSDAELAEVTTPFLRRGLTTEDLDDLRISLTRYYVDRGYINSGALIPDQKVEDGVLRVQIVEGRLTDVLVEGETTLSPEYLRERILLGAGPPLNINTLQERLQIQAQSPLVERLNADLQPGDRPGDAELNVQVEEPTSYQLALVTDNRLYPDLGEAQVRAIGQLNNLTGYGDVFTADVTFAEGLSDFALGYSRPLNRWDTTVSVYGERSDSKIVESPLDALDIKNDYAAVGARVDQPVYRTPSEQFSVGVAFEHRRSQSFLLGRGFPFAPGVESDGKSTVSVIRLSQDWSRRSLSQVVAARSTLSVGVPAFGATENPGSTPDSSFVAWLGQFQWARRLTDSGVEAIFRLDGQFTNDELLPLEQFSVGGAESVRGYRTNLLVRDWGYSTSIEFRMPLLRDEVGQPTLQGAIFYDMGGAWQNDRPTFAPRTISSAGFGLRWDPDPKIHGQIYWGIPLRDVDLPNDSIQDLGIHFLFSAQLF